MRYFIAERRISINGSVASIYFCEHTENHLTFDEDKAFVGQADVIDKKLNETYGRDGWELVRVMYYNSGVL